MFRYTMAWRLLTKRSMVDIIRPVGRVNRKPVGKQTCYQTCKFEKKRALCNIVVLRSIGENTSVIHLT